MYLKIAFLFLALLIVSMNEPSGDGEDVSLERYIPSVMIPVILDASERAEIYPIIFDEVLEIPYRLGQSFKQGDLLLRMRNDVYKAEYQKAKHAVDLATEDLRVKESLQASNLISVLELLQSRASLSMANAQMAEALRNYKSTLIIAPFDGKIATIHTRLYERPLQQRSMLEIFNDKVLIARLIIPASSLSRFFIGQEVPIFVKDVNKTVTAKIIHIGAEINPVSNTVNIEGEIDNADGGLMMGMVSFLNLDKEQSSP